MVEEMRDNMDSGNGDTGRWIRRRRRCGTKQKRCRTTDMNFWEKPEDFRVLVLVP